MPSFTTQAPTNQQESKSALKKKVKAAAAAAVAESSASPAPESPNAPSHPESSNGDVYESPYIKELYKNIRNVNKKITNASKVDNVIAENPGLSLDDLVAARKINADQKAQVLKKPSLQATLAQYEEQIAQYKKFDQEYKARAQAEKAKVERTLTERLVKEKENAVSAAKAEAATRAETEKRENLLLISRFLRLAAQRRADEAADPNLDENMALEAVLFLFYDGEDRAVESMLKYIKGSDEKVLSINGENLNTTYAKIKAASGAYAPPPVVEAEPEGETEAVQENQAHVEYPVQSDPTLANAGLTELIDGPLTSGHTEEATAPTGIPQTHVRGGNAAAEASWENGNVDQDLSASQEWVKVTPRDVTETDTGADATITAPAQTQSWADEKPDTTPPGTAANSSTRPQNGDGFVPVRSRGSRDGQPRGRGGRGEFRGRGRGEYRGRGRGGSRGGVISGRRPEES